MAGHLFLSTEPPHIYKVNNGYCVEVLIFCFLVHLYTSLEGQRRRIPHGNGSFTPSERTVILLLLLLLSLIVNVIICFCASPN